MLVSEEDDGCLWVSPLFAAIREELSTSSKDDPIMVTIDDCECPKCAIARGPIDFISTVLVYIPTKEGVFLQRLTPSEAQAIGEYLLEFSREIVDYKEELNEG
jgi:hypothetical protein